MFLHSGAAMHRHEYSAPLDPIRQNSIPRRSPLTRSAFSNPIPRIASGYEKPIPIIHTPSKRPLSEYTPRVHDHNHIVRFQEPEPESESMSDGGRSVANSEGSETTVGGSKGRRRRSTRSSTAFQLAHPAPTLTQKQRLLQIRPKLLLQLQQLAPDSRPRPAVDVVPSTLVVPRLTKKFTRMFRGKAELGVNDVMVVRSEDYNQPDSSRSVDGTDSDEEGMANRELLAVICQMPKDLGGSQGKAEIVLHDGSVWVATPLANNHYEFVSIAEHTTARWVKRPVMRRSVDFSSNTPPSAVNEFKFIFSVMNPNSRRHPIMASLTQSTLDIPDHYVSVSSSSGKHPPTSPMGHLQDDQSGDEELSTQRSTFPIDDDMKALIQITGIWVALREGLSPYFKYNDSLASNTGRRRSHSQPRDLIRSGIVESCTTTPESAQSGFGSVGGRFKRPCPKASPASVASSRFEENSIPQRSVSAGTAFMQRATARRANNTPSTVISDSEGEGIFRPPRRAATDDTLDSFSTQGQWSAARSMYATPENPTGRRVQSLYVSSGTPQAEHYRQSTERHSIDASNTHQHQMAPVGRDKTRSSRWKAFTNFFRRNVHKTTTG